MFVIIHQRVRGAAAKQPQTRTIGITIALRLRAALIALGASLAPSVRAECERGVDDPAPCGRSERAVPVALGPVGRGLWVAS